VLAGSRIAFGMSRALFPILLGAMRASRMQAFLVIVLCWILSFGQGRELALSLQVEYFTSIALGLFCVVYLSFELWLWSNISIVLSQRLRPARPNGNSIERRFRRNTPNLIASAYCLLLLGFVAFELFKTGERTTAIALAITNVVAVLVALLTFGHSQNDLTDELAGDSPKLNKIYHSEKSCISHIVLIDLSPEKRVLAILSLISSGLIFAGWTVFDVTITRALGAFGATFLALAILLPWLSLLVVLTESSGFPIVTAILLMPFVADTIYGSFGTKPERYAVRPVFENERNQSSIDPRLEIDAAVDGWRRKNDSGQSLSPIIFVTAAGGGIRAAYWAASVLGRLEDCIPNFGHRVFSLSGVSGGSLAVGSFATLLIQPFSDKKLLDCSGPLAWEGAAVGMGINQLFMRDLLSDDFLAPVIKEMLLVDSVRALLPWSSSEANRAVALELAWENAWEKACDDRLGLERCKKRISLSSPFYSLASRAGDGPALFLNGVHQETGKRLITSNLRVRDSQLIDAIDFFDFVKHDVRISTAILNSARFPIVSPSGALMRYGGNHPMLVGHVIDGGYFDNNGTLTSNEVSRVALKKLNALWYSGEKCDGPRARPVVFLEILNDTSLSDHDSIRSTMGDETLEEEDIRLSTDIENDPRTYQGLDMNLPARQLLTAIQGLDASRSARAVHASKTLAKFAARETCNKKFVQIRLCPGMIPDPPLGWTLSRESRNSMDALIIGHTDSQREQYKQSRNYSRVLSCYAAIQNSLDKLIKFLK
jgi:Patatin-like phospholipase